jgi:hypothetical protein
MHNIDRTNYESTYGEYGGYAGETEADEFGYEFEGDHEFETYGEYNQEGPFSEAEVMELASELLAVSDEAELDQFLGKLFKKASRAVGGFLKSPLGQKLAGAVKNIAKKALPALGGMAGNFLMPGVGGALGSQAASAAGNMLGLELEGLTYEDQEFEIAKQLVRLGGSAAATAAEVGGTAPPMQAAQNALATAAQQYAPGLVTGVAKGAQAISAATSAARKHPRANQGRWYRRGSTITLIGV